MLPLIFTFFFTQFVTVFFMLQTSPVHYFKLSDSQLYTINIDKNFLFYIFINLIYKYVNIIIISDDLFG